MTFLRLLHYLCDMDRIFLLLLIIGSAFSASAQDEIVFHVHHAQPQAVDSLPDGSVNIYWIQVAPMHDSLDDFTIRSNFGSMGIDPVYYSYRNFSDTSRLAYESIDITINHKHASTDYHTARNRFSLEMSVALNKTMPGDIVLIRLNRRNSKGQIKTERLTYRVITKFRFLRMKRANMALIRKGLPLIM